MAQSFFLFYIEKLTAWRIPLISRPGSSSLYWPRCHWNPNDALLTSAALEGCAVGIAIFWVFNINRVKGWQSHVCNKNFLREEDGVVLIKNAVVLLFVLSCILEESRAMLGYVSVYIIVCSGYADSVITRCRLVWSLYLICNVAFITPFLHFIVYFMILFIAVLFE